MPKFIGREIGGAQRLADNVQLDATSFGGPYLRLSYAQAALLDPAQVSCSLDTTDRGGPQSYAKRWFRWFARAVAVAAAPRATARMKFAAIDALRVAGRV